MHFDSLNDIFTAFSKLKVLIIGDVMIDSYLWGRVNRISPEAPVPIVDVKERERRLGGAANVALNVKSMEATAVLCSVIGNDKHGAQFIKLLEDNNLSTEGIFRSDSRMTTVKHRIIAGSQHLLRVDSENTHDLDKTESSELLNRIKLLIDRSDVIIFEDYDKGVLSESLISEIIQLATEKGIPTVVDPKKKNFLSYKNCTLYKPNLKELREGLKLDIDSKQIIQVIKAVDMLMSKLNNTYTLTTLSENGVLIKGNNEEIHIPAYLRDISDVSGAGDTVISVAALALALKLNPKLIANLSNLAGGLVCESVGVVPINKNKLLTEAQENNIL